MNMPHTTLIIGGCRSGKSSQALTLGKKNSGKKNLFVATGEALDSEMKSRIERHQRERGPLWETVESPVDVVGTIETKGPGSDIMLVDCLTLWTSNLMMARDEDDEIMEEINRLHAVLCAPPCAIILVTNEVGTGIVPENPLARRFRDLTGWCNQNIASACKEVIWMVAGIPVVIKPPRGQA